MTFEDNWTPARGWASAAVHIALRTIGALVLAWLGFWLLRLLIHALEGQIGREMSTIGRGVIVVFGLGTGLAAGLVLCHKLTEATGLLGMHLIAPACLPFLVGLVLLYHISVLTPPTWSRIALYQYCVTGLSACALVIRQLLLES